MEKTGLLTFLLLRGIFMDHRYEGLIPREEFVTFILHMEMIIFILILSGNNHATLSILYYEI